MKRRQKRQHEANVKEELRRIDEIARLNALKVQEKNPGSVSHNDTTITKGLSNIQTREDASAALAQLTYSRNDGGDGQSHVTGTTFHSADAIQTTDDASFCMRPQNGHGPFNRAALEGVPEHDVQHNTYDSSHDGNESLPELREHAPNYRDNMTSNHSSSTTERSSTTRSTAPLHTDTSSASIAGFSRLSADSYVPDNYVQLPPQGAADYTALGHNDSDTEIPLSISV